MEPGQRVMSHLTWLWESEKLLDVQLLCNNLPVASAHKLLLSAFSEYFATLFLDNSTGSSLKSVEYIALDDFDANNVFRIIRFLYTGTMGCLESHNKERLCALLNDTEKLGVKNAADYVRGYMQKKEFLSDVEAEALASVNITNSFDISGIDLNKSFDIDSGSLPQVLQDGSLDTELSISVKYPTPKHEAEKDVSADIKDSSSDIFCHNKYCDIGTQTEDVMPRFMNGCDFHTRGESKTRALNTVLGNCDSAVQSEVGSPRSLCNTSITPTDHMSISRENIVHEDVTFAAEESSQDGEEPSRHIRTRRAQGQCVIVAEDSAKDGEEPNRHIRTRSAQSKRVKNSGTQKGKRDKLGGKSRRKITQKELTLAKVKKVKKTKKGKHQALGINLESVVKTEDGNVSEVSEIPNVVALHDDKDVSKPKDKVEHSPKLKTRVKEDDVAVLAAKLGLEDLGIQVKQEEGTKEGEAGGQTEGDEEGDDMCKDWKEEGIKNTHRAKVKKKKPLSKAFFTECKQEDESFQCPSCNKLFSTAVTFRKHYMLSHLQVKQYHCNHCDKSFLDNFKLQEHVRVHTGERPFICPECGSSFKAKKHLTKHMKVHNRCERIPCTEGGCSQTFADRDQMSRHVRSKHLKLKPYKCTEPGCQFGAADSSGLKYHMQKHLPQKERMVHLCSICGAAVPGPSTNLKVHMVKHSTDYYSCHLCGYKTKYQMYLQTHITRKHGIDAKGEVMEKEFKCAHCDFSCYFKHEFKFHLKKHNPDKPFKCKLCEYSTLTQSQLNTHIRTHTGAKPFTCQQCHKSFSQSTHLVRHTRTHTGDKPHKCLECGVSFIEKRYLERHRYSVHLGYKPFMCHLCTYSCIKKDTLKNHIRNSHGSEALPEDMQTTVKPKILVSELPVEQQQLLRREGQQWEPQIIIPPELPDKSTPSLPYSPIKVQLAQGSPGKKRRRQNAPLKWKAYEPKLPPPYPDVPLDLNTSGSTSNTTTTTASSTTTNKGDDSEAIMKQIQFHHQLLKFNSSMGGGATGCLTNTTEDSNPGLQQPQRLVTPPSSFGAGGDDEAVNMVTNQPVQVRIQSGGSGGSHHTISLQLPEYLTIPLHKAAASSLTELQSTAAAADNCLNMQNLSGLDSSSLWSQGIYHGHS